MRVVIQDLKLTREEIPNLERTREQGIDCYDLGPLDIHLVLRLDQEDTGAISDLAEKYDSGEVRFFVPFYERLDPKLERAWDRGEGGF